MCAPSTSASVSMTILPYLLGTACENRERVSAGTREQTLPAMATQRMHRAPRTDPAPNESLVRMWWFTAHRQQHPPP